MSTTPSSELGPGLEPRARRAVLAVLFAGVLMGALDIAIVGPALPALQSEFGLSETDLGLVFGSYVLANLLGAPIMAKLSDRSGRRAIYLLDIALFALGSTIVAAAPSFAVLLAGRAVQGLGAGGILPVASAVIGDTFPPERRGGALGLVGAVFGLAFLVGPVLGGLILAHAGWRWLFVVNLPIASAVALAAWRRLPAYRPSTRRPFDLAGTAVLIVWLAALSQLIAAAAAMTERAREAGSAAAPADGPNAGWPPEAVVLLAGLVIVLPPVFVAVERRAPDPVVRLSLFARRPIRIALLLALVVGMAESAVVFVPTLLVEAFGVTHARASFMLLPIVAAMAVGAPAGGRALDRVGARPVVLSGCALLAIGMTSVALVGQSVARFYAAGVVVGMGLSVLLGAPLRYIVLGEAEAPDRAAAQGALSLSTNIGLLLGATLVGALAALRGGGVNGYTFAFQALGGCAAAAGVVATRLGRRHDGPIGEAG